MSGLVSGIYEKQAPIYPGVEDLPEEITNMLMEVNGTKADEATGDTPTGNFDSEVKAQLDLITLKALYSDDAWVYICCNLIARKISRQFMPVQKLKVENGALVVSLLPNHPFNQKMVRPNKQESYSTYMFRNAVELTLMGNAIIWKTKYSEEFILVPTELVMLEFDGRGNLLYYNIVSGTPDGSGQFYNVFRLKPEEVIHIKMPNPNSIYWGLSPWIPGRRSVLFERYSQEYLLNFYLKQANPGQVMEMGELANERQALRFLKSMEMHYTGRANQRRTMILPKGVTAKNNAHTFAEQQLRDHLQENKETIRALFAIPPHELGIQSAGSIGSEESAKQIRNFYESTIIPYQGFISEGHTMKLEKELGKGNILEFNNSDVAVLQENFLEKATFGEKMLKTMTLNEVRSRVWNLEALDGGDETPSTVVIDEFVKAQIAAMAAKPVAPAGAPAGTPSTQPAPNDNPSVGATAPQKHALSPQERARAFLAKNSAWWANRKAVGEEGDAVILELKMFEVLLDIFAKAFKEIDLAFFQMFHGKTISVRREKSSGPGRRKDSDLERLQKKIESIFKSKEILDAYNGEAIPLLFEGHSTGYDLGLNIPFNVPNRDAVEALGARSEDGRLAILQARGIDNFEGFTKTQTDTIINLVAKGVAEQKTPGQIAKEIQENFSETIPSKARTIARTETLTAVSLGQKAAEDDFAEINPGGTKMWITAGDDRVRRSHEAIDGVEVPIKNGVWKSGLGNELRFPRDPQGGAADVINCRCTFILIPEGESLDTSGIDFTGFQ